MLIGYARVSTEDQDLALQIAALKAAGCERIYEDKKSGKDMNRPGWKKCRLDLREGDTLVIWKLDRLGRSALDLIQLLGEFESEGIDFVCTTEGFDTRTPMGRCMYQISAAFAELERNMIAERTREGIAIAKETRGFIPGGLPRITPKIWDWATAKIEEYAKRKQRITDGALEKLCKAELGEKVSWNTFKKWRERLDGGGPYPEDWAAKFAQHKEYKKREKRRK